MLSLITSFLALKFNVATVCFKTLWAKDLIKSENLSQSSQHSVRVSPHGRRTSQRFHSESFSSHTSLTTGGDHNALRPQEVRAQSGATSSNSGSRDLFRQLDAFSPSRDLRVGMSQQAVSGGVGGGGSA